MFYLEAVSKGDMSGRMVGVTAYKESVDLSNVPGTDEVLLRRIIKADIIILSFLGLLNRRANKTIL